MNYDRRSRLHRERERLDQRQRQSVSVPASAHMTLIKRGVKCKKGGFVCIRHDELRNVATQKDERDLSRHYSCGNSTDTGGRDCPVKQLTYQMKQELDDLLDNSEHDGRKRAFLLRFSEPEILCHWGLTLLTAHERNGNERPDKKHSRPTFTPLPFKIL